LGLSLVSIGGSNLGSAGDSIKESSLTTKAPNVLEVIAIRCPVNVVVWIEFKIHFAKFYTKLKTIYLAATADPFPNSPRSSFQPNRTSRINKRMTALQNAKSTLSSAIDTVTKPYANATATTQETVSQVSSSNLSSIDNDGKLLVSSCLGGF
jgi:hypothetical protein